MRMTIYTANCRGNAKNSLYPNKRVIDNEDDCLEVMAFDHVCAEFKSYRRSNDNFLASDVEVMDCDNDHSDNPVDWIYPEKLSERIGQDVAFIMAYHADPQNTPHEPDEWLEQFNTFSIYQILPEIINLWGLNVQQQVDSKKNLIAVSGK